MGLTTRGLRLEGSDDAVTHPDAPNDGYFNSAGDWIPAMIYRDEDVLRQLRLGEDSLWEFKQIGFAGDRLTKPRPDDLADEIAAFANAEGGVLVCGVTDQGDVQGLSREQIVKLDARLVEISTNSIKPAVRIRTRHMQLEDGKKLLLVEIPEGEALHDSPGGNYLRVGGSKRRMASDERLRLAQRRGQARFTSFDEQPVPNTGFGTLDEALWKPLLSAEGAAEPEAALRKLALLAPDKTGIVRATVAGILLCTTSPERWLPNACITAVRYRGTHRASGQIDAQEITGPLNRQIADATAFATKNMRVASRKQPARVDLPEYSDKALFEALVNAVAHRDYSIRGSKIRLSMFEGRLEIQSPGSLPNNLTLESMAMRQATRNEALTSVLGRMPVGSVRGSEDRQYFMERRGDGVPIIQRETSELSGRPPEYCLIDGSEVRLTIPAAAQEQSPARAVITVRASGRPIPGVDLLILFPNKTWKRSITDEHGEAAVDLHTTHLPMTVFAAADGYAAHLERGWTPAERPLSLELALLPAGGAVVFPEATGQLPQLSGRLNPIRDTHDRTYLYASNIAIDEGRQQPVSFVLGDELHLTDAEGRQKLVRIVEILGRSALVEYRSFPSGSD